MKESSKNGGNQELIQQLNDLEKEWETLKKGKLQNTRRCSTGSDSSSFIVNPLGQLFENSPRGLMYSLQRRRSPSDDEGFLRLKNRDMAVEEVVRERRAAIVSGRLKGRRLFGAAASAVELDLNYHDGGGGSGGGGGGGGGGEACGEWLNVMGEREVVTKGRAGESELPDAISLSCNLFSDASLYEEKEVMEEEKVVVEKRRGVGGCGGGARCIMAMAWLALLVILLVLGLVSMSCNGKNVHENELILVPT